MVGSPRGASKQRGEENSNGKICRLRRFCGFWRFCWPIIRAVTRCKLRDERLRQRSLAAGASTGWTAQGRACGREREFNMIARSMFVVVAISLLTGAGCCCGPCGGVGGGAFAGGGFAGGPIADGGCGPSCGPHCGCGLKLPKPIRYPGSTDCEGCNSSFAWCRAPGESAHWGGACGSCASNGSPCGGCGLLNFLRCRGTSCKGCGEVYYGQWLSDPPNCCDTCDSFAGANSCGGQGCGNGFFARLAAGIHGGRTGGGTCGCSSCAGGGQVTYDGGMIDGGVIHGGMMGSPSLLDQNWDMAPTPAPVPGKPIHNAEAPPHQRSAAVQRPVPRTAPRTAPRVMRTASTRNTMLR